MKKLKIPGFSIGFCCHVMKKRPLTTFPIAPLSARSPKMMSHICHQEPTGERLPRRTSKRLLRSEEDSLVERSKTYNKLLSFTFSLSPIALSPFSKAPPPFLVFPSPNGSDSTTDSRGTSTMAATEAVVFLMEGAKELRPAEGVEAAWSHPSDVQKRKDMISVWLLFFPFLT